jgi:hypothetical protein
MLLATSVTNPALGMDMPTNVSVDKLALVWRYPAAMMHCILGKVQQFIQGNQFGYHVPKNPAGAQARLRLMLLHADLGFTGEFADVRFCLTTPSKGTPHSHVRVEWNPAKAGSSATAYLLDDLATFLPHTNLMAEAYVTRIDLAVDVPGIRCAQLAAQRTSNHKNAQVFVGAKGEVNSIRIGARGSSAKTGTFLRVYDKPLPDYEDEMGVRAEIEVSRSGHLAAIGQVDPVRQIPPLPVPPRRGHGLFACFVSAARERGVKRALALLSSDKALAADFQAILDQCPAPWWDAATLLDQSQRPDRRGVC